MAGSGYEKRLEMLQVEHESLKVEYEQQKQKVRCFQMHVLLLV